MLMLKVISIATHTDARKGRFIPSPFIGITVRLCATDGFVCTVQFNMLKAKRNLLDFHFSIC